MARQEELSRMGGLHKAKQSKSFHLNNIIGSETQDSSSSLFSINLDIIKQASINGNIQQNLIVLIAYSKLQGYISQQRPLR